MRKTLVVDIETHSADKLYTLPATEFVRLIGYSWDGGDVVLTTDLEEIRAAIREARWTITHNGHAFDLPAIFGVDSIEPLQLARQGRLVDTWTHATLVNPAPSQYTNRHGRNALAAKPEQMRKWFALDEQAYQLGVPGKTHDLKALAREFSPDDADAGYGLIPVDDERYRDYLVGDVRATEAVGKALLARGPLDPYALREQLVHAIMAQISRNGLRVDVPAAAQRVAEVEAEREGYIARLVKFGLPTEGKAPLRTTEGKAAVLAALEAVGVREKDLPRTKGGSPSLGGKTLVEAAKGHGPEAEALAEAIAGLGGLRPLAQQALDYVQPDVMVHPDVSMLQRSGRASTTAPGLTTWTSRGPGATEKSYFLPDTPEHVLLEVDYSNADARVVAALSGDRKYAVRFRPGMDGHTLNAVAAWGQATVDTDPDGYRFKAKALGHGWNYGGQAATLAKQAGLPFAVGKKFCDGMNASYRVLVGWQDRVRESARRFGYVRNMWGRVMPVEPGREFTQAPALAGQSGTREIVCDALIRFTDQEIQCVKAFVHDALLFSIPRDGFEEIRDGLITKMATVLNPQGGQRIEFPVEAGPAGDNWYKAAH